MSNNAVDSRMAVNYDLAKDVLRYCTRETVYETEIEQVYRWVDGDQQYAYGVYTKTGGLVEFHETMFEGAEADELKDVGRGIPRPIVIAPLPANHKVGILWNGGWDDYKVDPAQVRDMTADELATTDENWPTLGNHTWLKCSFLKQYGLGNDNQAIRILAHLGGGD